MGITRQQVSLIETGKSRLGGEQALRAAEELGCSVAVVLGERDLNLLDDEPGCTCQELHPELRRWLEQAGVDQQGRLADLLAREVVRPSNRRAA